MVQFAPIMTATQLDLFGSLPKPPLKIREEEDTTDNNELIAADEPEKDFPDIEPEEISIMVKECDPSGIDADKDLDTEKRETDNRQGGISVIPMLSSNTGNQRGSIHVMMPTSISASFPAIESSDVAPETTITINDETETEDFLKVELSVDEDEQPTLNEVVTTTDDESETGDTSKLKPSFDVDEQLTLKEAATTTDDDEPETEDAAELEQYINDNDQPTLEEAATTTDEETETEDTIILQASSNDDEQQTFEEVAYATDEQSETEKSSILLEPSHNEDEQPTLQKAATTKEDDKETEKSRKLEPSINSNEVVVMLPGENEPSTLLAANVVEYTATYKGNEENLIEQDPETIAYSPESEQTGQEKLMANFEVEKVDELAATSGGATEEANEQAAVTEVNTGEKIETEAKGVPADDDLFKRQYYTMRETAAMFGVNQSLLRFWENEFNILKPKKNKKGDRYFRPADIKNLQLIYHLLKVRKFTIDGARDYLKNNHKALDTFELLQKLEKLKGFLQELSS